MEEGTLEKPLQAHASLVEDPDEGLTEEEIASIVRLAANYISNCGRVLMFLAGSQTTLEVRSPSNSMAIVAVPCRLSRSNEHRKCEA